MFKFDDKDRQRLIASLQGLPLMGDYNSRRAILVSAGLEDVIPQVNLEGSAFVFVATLIERLVSLGRVTFEHEALGRLLNALKGMTGEESQRFFDHLLIKYDLMVPAINNKKSSQWETDYSSEQVLERIIGENTLKDLAFLERGLEVARAVAYIQVGNKWSGTGFMISQNLLITNHHVIPSKNHVDSSIFRFNYQLNFGGAPALFHECHAISDNVFFTNVELDYTIVALDEAHGNDWRYLHLSKGSALSKGDRVNIIQHPHGLPKQISFQNNFVASIDTKVVQYYTSTLEGSSGAPVFNDKWEVVAIHHAGGMLLDPETKRRHYRNEGIRIPAILEDLPSEILNQLPS